MRRPATALPSTLSPVSSPFLPNDLQGKLPGIERALRQSLLAYGHGLASLEAPVDIDVRRDVFPITGRLEDRDGRSYVGQVGPRLGELLFRNSRLKRRFPFFWSGGS
jgi:hypothetical protein